MIYAPKILSRKFYNQKTLTIAQALLGKFLIRKIGKKIIAGMITETEAYRGPNDLASHASRGRTPRTELMFGPAGYAYIYMIYGMYYCLNVVTEKKDFPAAVLIRGVKIEGVDYNKTNGSGKFCKFFKIDKALNGCDITINTSPSPSFERRGNMLLDFPPRTSGGRGEVNSLWIEDHGVKIKLSKIKRTPRIGVDYAGEFKDKKWRFLLKLG